MPIKGILFDLDGTVINTNDLILHTFDYTFDKILNLKVPTEQLIQTFGRPLHQVMAEFDAEKADLLLTTYRAYNAQVHDQMITLFPKVAETLGTLQDLGYKLAIVTSKKNDIALRGLDLFHLTPYFDVFIGSEDTILHKPNPDPLLKALDLLGIAPNEALMVGDSPYDLISGQQAGTKTIGVAYSVHGSDVLQSHHPDYMIDQFDDILNILQTI